MRRVFGEASHVHDSRRAGVHPAGRSIARSRVAAVAAGALALCLAAPAEAQDLASVVARARSQLDNGNYAEAGKILASLKNKELPSALAIEVGLIETSVAIVTSPDAATAACGRAVVAAGYDPNVARDQSPKVREVCRVAADKVRAERLGGEGLAIGKLAVRDPEVAFAPVRISTKLDKAPEWLRIVARIQSDALKGSFDLPLLPGDDGQMLGTLDASWLRPSSELEVALVAQDRHGDLGTATEKRTLSVPKFAGLIALGEVPSGAVVKLDGDKVTPDAQGRIPVEPGEHEVSLTLSNGANATTDVDVKRGAIVRVALAPQLSSGSRVWPWVATGTALTLGATGAVFMIVADSRRADLEEAAARREPGTELPATSYAELQSIDDQRNTFNTVGTGLLIGGGAMAVLATILWIVPSGDGPADEAAPATNAGLRVQPLLGPGFVGLQGSF